MEDAEDRPPSFDSFLELLDHDGEVGWEKDMEGGNNEGEWRLASLTYTPLEVALMMRANLATIQRAYRMNPHALTAETLRNACRHGAQPGVVGFLASELPQKAVSTESPDPLDGRLPVHLAMMSGPGFNRPTEEDIVQLVKIYPQCVGEEDPNEYYEPWRIALRWKYSPELLTFLIQTFVEHCGQSFSKLELDECILCDNSEDEHLREAIDLDCVQAMSLLFPKINHFQSVDVNWKVDALAECICLILQNPNITKLELSGSTFPLEDEDGDGPQLNAATVQSLLQLAEHCGIEFLTLRCARPQENPFFPLLSGDFVLRIPRLQSLETDVGEHIQPVIPFLCQLVRTSQTLETLRVFAGEYPKGEYHHLLTAISTNTILKEFVYQEEGKVFYQTAIHSNMAISLETSGNTTLQSVTIGATRQASHGRVLSFSEKLIDYYMLLNRHGRGIARHHSTQLAGFVPLLHPEPSRYDPYGSLSEIEVHNIRYGLLREAPALWSGVCSKKTT